MKNKRYMIAALITAMLLAGCGNSDTYNEKVSLKESETEKDTQVSEDGDKAGGEKETSENSSKDTQDDDALEDNSSDGDKTQNDGSDNPQSDAGNKQETAGNGDNNEKNHVGESGNSNETVQNTTTNPPTSQPATARPTAPQPTTTQHATEPPVYFVETTTESVETGRSTRFGITEITYKFSQYNIYSDGSKKLVSSWEEKKTQGSFSISDSELRTEAERVIDANMANYQSVLEYTNKIRSEAGKAPLQLNRTLCIAATMRAIEMDYANYFDHVRADGRDVFTIYDSVGYEFMAAGENIAKGYRTPAAVTDGWKNSPGHYANMISDNYGNLGVGFSNSQSGAYYVQLFSD